MKQACTRMAALVGLASLVIAIAGCGGSGATGKGWTTSTGTGSGTSAISYLGTQSPGDYWDWTLGSGTFSAIDNTTGNTYSGTSTLVPSGFYKLSVTTSTDSAAVGNSAYAFEVPGVAIVVQPAGKNSAPVVGAEIGVGPPAGSSNVNWVDIPPSTWNPTDAAYGTAVLDTSNGSTGVAIDSFTLSGTDMGVYDNTYLFQNGHLQSADQTQNGVYTPDGVAIIDEGPAGGCIGVVQPSSDVDLTDVASQQYRGILFKGGSHSQLVWAQPNGSGGLLGGNYTDVDTNTENTSATSEVTFSFTGQSSPGLVQGTIAYSNETVPMACSINKAGGRYMIFGFCLDKKTGMPDNFMLIQQ
jgi:hypothetical protein